MITRLKALNFRANNNRKEDILMVLHDINTGTEPTVGFSIKSRLGQASTLFNASGATNFLYEVIAKSKETLDSRMDQKIKDYLSSSLEKGFNFKFIGTSNETFTNNLRMVDSQFPLLISKLLFNFYSGKSKNLLTDALTTIVEENPFGLENHANWYEHKLKAFITGVALGMVPTRPWSGDFDANGGYIVVKEDGDVLCYHIYNLSEFQEYLLNNTKFDFPSTTRHGYGDIEEIGGKQIFKLNLQIRFLK
jgi:type II restriction enzyme